MRVSPFIAVTTATLIAIILGSFAVVRAPSAASAQPSSEPSIARLTDPEREDAMRFCLRVQADGCMLNED